MLIDRSDDCEASTSRRGFLAGGASLALWGLLPRAASAAGATDRRLLVVVLRGGLDGLSLLAPVGDPAYAALRGPQALTRAGSPGAGLPIDDLFVLNPAMAFVAELYAKREALLVHAVATPYRGRSHFDGQDVLESGEAGVGRVDTGWLNRALTGLASGGRAHPGGLSIGAVVPLVMRGRAPVLTWSPPATNNPLADDTVRRLGGLYAARDPALARALTEGLKIEGLTGGNGVVPATGPHKAFIETAAAAAKLMSAPGGPRIGTLSYDGWDTHANEGAIGGLLATRLGALDAALKAYAEGLGSAWAETVVVVITEFGRTVRINGTNGTDHGTATAAILAGGRVAGQRVIADWPGLQDAALVDGRDLRPTTDLRGILKGVLADHLGVPAGVLGKDIFPDSAGALPARGLVRAS